MIIAVIYTTYAVVKLKLEKNRLERPLRCAVLYQLSYQVNWELATLLVRNIPVDGEGVLFKISDKPPPSFLYGSPPGSKNDHSPNGSWFKTFSCILPTSGGGEGVIAPVNP